MTILPQVSPKIQYSLILDDVLAIPLSKSQLKNQDRFPLLLPLKFSLSPSMTGMTEGPKITQIIGDSVVSLKTSKWYLMMNRKSLAEFSLALLLSKPAILTGIAISLEGLAPLSIPVRPVPVGLVSVYESWVVFFYPVFISTLTTTVFTAPLLTLRTLLNQKNLLAIKASRFHHSLFGSISYGLILALRRAMLTPTVFHSARENVKDFCAILAGSGYHCFHFDSQIKLPRRPGAGVEAATQKALGGANRLYQTMRLNKKCARLGSSCFDVDIIAQGF